MTPQLPEVQALAMTDLEWRAQMITKESLSSWNLWAILGSLVAMPSSLYAPCRKTLDAIVAQHAQMMAKWAGRR
jgi:hypothetical protein